MRRPVVAAVLLSFATCFAACDLFDGEVVLANSDDAPRLYHVAVGASSPADVDPQNLVRLDPGERVVLGHAEALADSGGITVTVFAIPRGAGAEPDFVRVDAVGWRFLRETFGDTVLGGG